MNAQIQTKFTDLPANQLPSSYVYINILVKYPKNPVYKNETFCLICFTSMNNVPDTWNFLPINSEIFLNAIGVISLVSSTKNEFEQNKYFFIMSKLLKLAPKNGETSFYFIKFVYTLCLCSG